MADEKFKKPSISFVPMLLEVGFDISIPLLLFVLLGVWADNQFHTSHFFLLSGMALSLFSSSMALYKAYKKIRVAEGAEEERK